jgi:ammonium transporter, Amt family
MNPAAPVLSEAATVLVLACLLLIPLAIAGIALINTGLGRSRSASHTMLAALCAVSVAAAAYFVCGFAIQGFAGGPAHTITAAGKQWNWIADQPLFLRGLPLDGSYPGLVLWLQLLSVALAALIPLGAGLDRWRLGAASASTALLAGLVYPLFAHWVWSGGWLAQIGFVDAAGGAPVQAVGGLTALAIAWILGPRRGKYSSEGGLPAAIPGHNAVLVLFACFLAWAGWLGLNGAGAMLFGGAPVGALVRVGLNTTLSAAMAGLAAAAITRARFGRPDASLCANGWVGGLAASSAGCLYVTPAVAALAGLVAGALVVFTVEWLDIYGEIDDPTGSVSVHAVGGIWGVLALGFFARSGAPVQTLSQIAGVATLLGFVLPIAYGLNWLLDRLSPQRVAPEGERQGLDLHELGAGAYPEFVIHREDFLQR